jgi:peptidoglycan/LPS O-acetylase OafA/YrhL
MKSFLLYFYLIIFLVWATNLYKDFRQNKIQKISDLYFSIISLLVGTIIALVMYHFIA